MPDITLASEPRPPSSAPARGAAQREGEGPAVVYGLGNDPVWVHRALRALTHILAGESGSDTLISLSVGGDDVLTLVRQIQRHPTRGDLVHVDFVRVRGDHAVNAEVPVHIVGEPAGVHDGGILEQLRVLGHRRGDARQHPGRARDRRRGRSGSATSATLSDLTLPEGVTTQLDPETVVVFVAAPRVVADGGRSGRGRRGCGRGRGRARSDAAAEGDSGEE